MSKKGSGKITKNKVSTDTSYYQDLLQNPNIQAYLKTIRRGEGTLKSGYETLVGGGNFSDFSHHPNIYKKQFNSTAAGAYQFIYKTWIGDATNLKLKDFGPVSQDIGALYEINKAGALDDVLNGNIEAAIEKTKKVWVSLPGAQHDKINKYSQKLTDALKFYKNNGGTLHNRAFNIAADNFTPNKISWQTGDILQNYTPPAAIADHTRITVPVKVRIIKREQEDNDQKTKGTSINPLYSIKTLLDMPELFKAGLEITTPASLNNKKRKYPVFVPPLTNDNSGLPDVQKLKNKIQPPVINEDQIMKNIFMDHPGIKNKWDIPKMVPDEFPDNLYTNPYAVPLADNLRTPGSFGDSSRAPDLNIIHDTTGSNNDILERLPFSRREKGNNKFQENDPGDDMASNIARTVNVSLNAPMIGNFTISIKDATGGLSDLRQQVEGVLLEVLNSANAIQ